LNKNQQYSQLQGREDWQTPDQATIPRADNAGFQLIPETIIQLTAEVQLNRKT